MSDLAELGHGERPWQPTSDSVPGVVFHRYDQPLIGTFEQHGVMYLYACLHGVATPVQIWTYRRVDAADVARWSALEPDELRAALLTAATNSSLQVAISLGDLGLVLDTVVDDARDLRDVLQAAGGLLRAWVDVLMHDLPSARSIPFAETPTEPPSRAAAC